MRDTRSRTNSGPRRFMGGAAISTNRTAHSLWTVSVSKTMGSPRLGGSAERKGEGLDARGEELDLELTILDRARLPDELIQALLRCRSIALGVHVAAVSRPRRLSVDEDGKADGG